MEPSISRVKKRRRTAGTSGGYPEAVWVRTERCGICAAVSGHAMSGLLAAYRRTGADPPFGDPARDHGAAMEGYYWRLVHPEAGWVIVWLCGVCQGYGGSWATVALAAHPGG